MGQPVKLYPETTPRWLSVVTPIETAFEKARRIEKAFAEVEAAKANAKAVYEDRLTHLDDYELFLHDQWTRVTAELEQMGEG